MTIATDSYLRFIEVIRETFPANERFELTNPYVLDANAEALTKTGWGVAALPINNLRRLASCAYSLSREIEVSLTNLVVSTDRDNSARQAIEAKLFEDQLKLIKAIDEDGTLNDLLAKNDFLGDNGIEFVFNEKNNYVALVSTWNIEYHINI